MKQLDLDGVYIRVERNGKYYTRCFTDLTQKEQLDFLSKLAHEDLINLCVYLGSIIRHLGEDTQNE